MTKIVYNSCHGGFSLSNEAIMRYAEIKGITLYSKVDSIFTHYYLCPPDEFKRLQDEDAANPVSVGRYDRSNAMYFSDCDIDRADPALAQVVEELGDRANGICARLRVEDVPAGTLYHIDEYDGYESVMTQDTYEWKVA